MGIALAEAAAEYGAQVDLVLGPVKVLPKNNKINIVSVVTAESMAEECISRFTGSDIAILAAAVADFTAADPAENKIKRTGDELILRLKPTRDIAAALGRAKRPDQILAGFALETNDELSNATAKLIRKNLDLIIMNSLQDEGAGFGYDTNRITIIDRNNNIDKFELKSKVEAARDILDKIVVMLKS
jgi:phosphopantothenoylcysteine decarboxylase/phosphopantothenate--cysteine ligase